jgi:biopolymer transport protein ExbB
MFKFILKILTALTFLSFAPVVLAQQSTIAPQPAASQAQAPAVAPAAAAQVAAPAVATPAQPATTPAATPPATASDTPPADSAPRPSLTLTIPHELSPWSMFLSADIIVKIVMMGLAFASLVTWTIFIAKSMELSVARRKLRRTLGAAANARSLVEAQMALGKKSGVLSTFIAEALHEARLSAGISSDTGIKERAASRFAEISRAEARRIRFGMGLLATIGSTSPFVGLFGTVWGIMNSFIGISKSQTTNLAVVAPGIAEALLATAIGLVAAIPAVIIYNHFARVTRTYLEQVGRASGAAARLLSRDLDRSHGGEPQMRAAAE